MNYKMTTVFILDMLVILASRSLFFLVSSNLCLFNNFLKDLRQMNPFSKDRICIFAYFSIHTNVRLAIWWNSFKLLGRCLLYIYIYLFIYLYLYFISFIIFYFIFNFIIWLNFLGFASWFWQLSSSRKI